MSDMSVAIVAKSDQLNNDDLLTGPITIKVTSVKIKSGDQPVTVSYEGDGGKPYKPCKSMSRVMVHVWGRDSAAYIGRSMTLYSDPKVTWGGMEVGGIRISAISGIDQPLTMSLTETKGKKKPFTVRPLVIQQPAEPEPEDKALLWVENSLKSIAAAADHAALEAITGKAAVVKNRASLAENRPDLAKLVDDAIAAKLAAFEGAPT